MSSEEKNKTTPDRAEEKESGCKHEGHGGCCGKHDGEQGDCHKHESKGCCKDDKESCEKHEAECDCDGKCKKDTDGQAENNGSQTEKQPEVQPEKKPEDEALETKYLRLAADFQNFRNRTERERGDIYARANESLMSDILPVLDDFERALKAAESADKGMKEGMEAIFKKFKASLEKHGLSEIEALGKEFDPNFHNAVMTCPAEGDNSGKVADVLQKGYTLNGKVLRPSMVKVAE